MEISQADQDAILNRLEKSEKEACQGVAAHRRKAKRIVMSAKAALEKAFYDIGGVDGLAHWGKNNRSEFYRLWSKIIPLDVSAKMKFERLIIAQTPEDPKVIEHQPSPLRAAGDAIEQVIVEEIVERSDGDVGV